jgi:hypothetical protein
MDRKEHDHGVHMHPPQTDMAKSQANAGALIAEYKYERDLVVVMVHAGQCEE